MNPAIARSIFRAAGITFLALILIRASVSLGEAARSQARPAWSRIEADQFKLRFVFQQVEDASQELNDAKRRERKSQKSIDAASQKLDSLHAEAVKSGHEAALAGNLEWAETNADLERAKSEQATAAETATNVESKLSALQAIIADLLADLHSQDAARNSQADR